MGKFVVISGLPASGKSTLIKALKENDKKLSVAYHLTLRVEEGGYKYCKLPTEVPNANGRMERISYEVSIDLEKYYDKYCKASGFEKEKLSNVTDASEVVTNINKETPNSASICYGYESGEAQRLDYKLEGGELVFTTTSHLTNLCIAGINLDSYLYERWCTL